MRALDLFAGAGGWTLGASRAGLSVVAALNHDPVAVASHAANHPHAAHVCQDAGLVDPRDVPAFDVLLASPACQGHSPARGVDRPHHDASRATAWCVVNFAEVCSPRVVLVENVPAFAEWALYPHWRAALSALGYRVSETVLCASEHGVPQERERLFVVAVRGKRPVALRSAQFAPVPAASFVSLDEGQWSAVEGHAQRTLDRIARARASIGSRFVAPYYGSGSGLTGRSLERPIGTITTIDRWAVVDGERMRMLSVSELRAAMGFPPSYVLTGTRREQVRQLGNAVVPAVAESVARQVLAAL